jgi:hypothetical protein
MVFHGIKYMRKFEREKINNTHYKNKNYATKLFNEN